MRYRMLQRLLTVGDRGVIYDEQGNVAYRSNGRFFRLRDRISVVDAEGIPVASLKSRLMEWPRALHVEIGGEPAAKVIRKRFSFRLVFDIALATGEKWTLDGRWTDHAFDLIDHAGSTIARVSRDGVALSDGDSDGIDIDTDIDITDGQDDLLVLMIIVALETSADPEGELEIESAF